MNLPYLIGECGVNHEGDLETARRMIHALATAGWHAAKFQVYKADRLAARVSPTYFHGGGVDAPSQWAFFKRYDALEPDDYRALAAECQAVGIDFLATAFDVETLEWVEPLVPALKIASADIVNVPLLEAARRIGKAVYLSTGAATPEEITSAVRLLSPCPVTLLHCVLAYPTPPEHAALGTIRWLQEHYPCAVGYSDHTRCDTDVLTTAWLLGATVIEKHITLDKAQLGNDHYHAADPGDAHDLMARLHTLHALVGSATKDVGVVEEQSRRMARQSWHAARDLAGGEILTAADVVLKRPADGLPPGASPVGRHLLQPVAADSPITVGCLA